VLVFIHAIFHPSPIHFRHSFSLYEFESGSECVCVCVEETNSGTYVEKQHNEQKANPQPTHQGQMLLYAFQRSSICHHHHLANPSIHQLVNNAPP
jgi:hypothetical protein